MRSRSPLAVGVAVGAIVAISGAALAQPATRATTRAPATARAPAAAAPPAAAPNISYGPALPGVCIVYVDKALGESLVGKAYDTRMQQLLQQVNAELQPQATSLQSDRNSLESQRSTLDGPTFEKRA